MQLNLFEEGKGRLDPLVYSNGKTQVDVVEDLLDAFQDNDLVWLDGKVGSGKSAIGIRTALEMGGGTISVPTKVLSDQYYDDYYVGDKYFEDNAGGRAEVAVFKGRRNFECPLMKSRHPGWDDWRVTCSNRSLPCSKTLSQNESREAKLSECPWGGMIKRERMLSYPDSEFDIVEDYFGLGEYGTVLLKENSRGGGPDFCPYWEQYRKYPFADIIAMNSQKFKIETWIERLPHNPLIIIDESDAFLDGLCSKVILSGKKLGSVYEEIRDNMESEKKREAIMDEIKRVWRNLREGNVGPMEAVEGLSEVLGELKWENSLYYDLNKIIDFRDQCTYEDKLDEDNPRVIFYLANPKPVLYRLLNKLQAKVLFMSATKIDRGVLNDIFGIDPVVVEGEPEFPGTLVERKTGEEVEVNYKNWSGGDGFVSDYKWARRKILEDMSRPGFVPIHAFKYVPSDIDPRDLQGNRSVEREGVEFSTKMDRGSDLGEKESVAILKYPYPNTQDPLMQAMKKKLGDSRFWDYYQDMARREFVQQIGRIMRSPDARKEFWSPDLKCHEKLEKHWEGDVETL